MSTPGLTAPASHRYPPLPRKPLSGISYIRKHFYAPEVLPLVGVVLCSLSMGLYFSQNASKSNDIQWQTRTQPWLRTATDRAHWDGAGGAKEQIKNELRK